MQMIHKLGILLAILLSTIIGSAQNKTEKIFDMYSGKAGVITLSFNKSVVEPLEIFLDEDSKRVLLKMKNVKLLIYNQTKGDFLAQEVFNRISDEFTGGKYFEIDPNNIDCENFSIKTDSKSDQVRIIGHGMSNSMDEFHMLIYDNGSTMLFTFIGDITVEDLQSFCKFSHQTKNNFVY